MNQNRCKVQGPRRKDSTDIHSAFSVRRSATDTKQKTQNPILMNPDALRPAPCAVGLAPCANEGKTPVKLLRAKRHKQCPDCSFCQGCSKDRCRMCRISRKRPGKKLTIAEQIALYERLNRSKGRRKPLFQ
jgi:hypothetical protein